MKNITQLFLTIGLFFSVIFFPQKSFAQMYINNPVAGWFTLGAESTGDGLTCGEALQENDFQTVEYSTTIPVTPAAFGVEIHDKSTFAVLSNQITFNDSILPLICTDYSTQGAHVQVAGYPTYLNFSGKYGVNENPTAFWGKHVIANTHLKPVSMGSFDVGLVHPSSETVGADPSFEILLGSFPNIYGATGVWRIQLAVMDPDGIMTSHFFFPTGGIGTYTLPPIGLTKEGDYLWGAYITLNGSTPVMQKAPVSAEIGPVAFTLKTTCDAPWGVSYPSEPMVPIYSFTQDTVTCGNSCSAFQEARYCYNGQWFDSDPTAPIDPMDPAGSMSSIFDFDYMATNAPSCVVVGCLDCSIPGFTDPTGASTFSSGSTVLGYPSMAGPCMGACAASAESRFCFNGELYNIDPELGGVFSDFEVGTVGSCIDGPSSCDCSAPLAFHPTISTVNNLDTLTAWNNPSGTCATPCESENRACINQFLTGSFQYPDCTPVTGCPTGLKPGKVIETKP